MTAKRRLAFLSAMVCQSVACVTKSSSFCFFWRLEISDCPQFCVRRGDVRLVSGLQRLCYWAMISAMSKQLRWGILATGNIAHHFADGLADSTRTCIAAVGSRTQAAANAYAQKHSVPHSHGSYDALLADDSVDAIYLSLPNSMHHEWTLKSLRAGKHVLCEKPLAANTVHAEEMFSVAEREDRLLVEAFMYRSHPATHALLEQVNRGVIGKLRLIRTSFCYRRRVIENNVRFDATLDGGALMDVGCYCINFSRLFAGTEPIELNCIGRVHVRGVDEYAAGTMGFANGIIATFVCGMTVQTQNAAMLCGDEGYIEVPVPWKPSKQAQFTVASMAPPQQDGKVSGPKPPQTAHVNSEKSLYALEADDFATAALDGAEPVLSRDDSLGNMRVLERLIRQIVKSDRSKPAC